MGPTPVPRTLDRRLSFCCGSNRRRFFWRSPGLTRQARERSPAQPGEVLPAPEPQSTICRLPRGTLDGAFVTICTINVPRCQAGVLARYYPRAPGAAPANPIVGGCSIRMRPSLVTRSGARTRGPGGLTHFAASIPSAKPKVATPNTAICLWSRAERSAVFASPTSRPRAATCRHSST